MAKLEVMEKARPVLSRVKLTRARAACAVCALDTQEAVVAPNGGMIAACTSHTDAEILRAAS